MKQKNKGLEKKRASDKAKKEYFALKNLKGVNPYKLNQFGYERFTQDSEEHLKACFVSLNNRFPNLVGFGVVQYMKQLWALNPRAKFVWDDDNIQKICAQMNIQREIFDEVINYCVKNLKIFNFCSSLFELDSRRVTYIVYPDFMEYMVELEVKKIREEATKTINKFKSGEPGEETAAQEKKRMIAEMMEFLKLDAKMKEQVITYFPLIGEPETLWTMFCQDVQKNYKKWHMLLTPDNYVSNFTMWLNKRPMTKTEILNEDKHR